MAYCSLLQLFAFNSLPNNSMFFGWGFFFFKPNGEFLCKHWPSPVAQSVSYIISEQEVAGSILDSANIHSQD